MFRYFEKLVDPYVSYVETDTPPQAVWPFMKMYCAPFKRVFVVTGAMSVVVAAIEIWLIFYMGRVVDLLGSDPSQMWANYGTELILVALFILIIRPLMQGIDVMLINNAILPNVGTLFRWRAHRQVLRQSVGWFENDFAGRIANRIMQTPPAAGEVVFQTFDAISYSLAYLIGAAILLTTSDWRLLSRTMSCRSPWRSRSASWRIFSARSSASATTKRAFSSADASLRFAVSRADSSASCSASSTRS